MRVVPNLDMPISKGANAQISAYLTIYPQAGGGEPALSFEFLRDGAVVGRSAAELPNRTKPDASSSSRRFPRRSLQPGTYELAGGCHPRRHRRELANPLRADPMTLRPASTIAILVIAYCVFGAIPDAAQRKPQQAPAFRSEAELVTVDVVVADKRGDPVADLRAEDFAVTEEGRPQKVQFFQSVTTALRTRSETAPGRAYRYSTNVGAQAHAGRSFVLFVDDVHLSQEQGERAKKALEQFLNDEAETGDLVSLVAPAKALRWHTRLPVGRPELVKILSNT